MTNYWMVRAGRGGRLADTFRRENYVAIGWEGVGKLPQGETKDAYLAAVAAGYPRYSAQQVQNAASQLYRFVQGFQVGDRVATYDANARKYYCGEIVGGYEYHPDSTEEVLLNRRAVRWDAEIERDGLSVSARNSLGSTLTIFRISSEVAAELWNENPSEIRSMDDVSELNSDASIDFELNARETVKDQIASLDWSELQELVAGLLRAMGYKTLTSPSGPDQGKDIIASPDGFGFQEPRIVVEVKHRAKQRMGAPELRSFLGGRHPKDKGLYVSTGGFTLEARYEADRASIPVRLLDLEDLVEAVFEHYEQFDLEAQQLLPLKRVYWPISS